MKQTKSAAQLAGVTSEAKFAKSVEQVQQCFSYLPHHVVWMHLGTGNLSLRFRDAILILFSAGSSAELRHLRPGESVHGGRPSAARRRPVVRAARRQGHRERIQPPGRNV